MGYDTGSSRTMQGQQPLDLRRLSNIQLHLNHGNGDNIISLKLKLYHLPLYQRIPPQKVHKTRTWSVFLKDNWNIIMDLKASLTLELLGVWGSPQSPCLSSWVRNVPPIISAMCLTNSKASFTGHVSSRHSGCFSCLGWRQPHKLVLH